MLPPNGCAHRASLAAKYNPLMRAALGILVFVELVFGLFCPLLVKARMGEMNAHISQERTRLVEAGAIVERPELAPESEDGDGDFVARRGWYEARAWDLMDDISMLFFVQTVLCIVLAIIARPIDKDGSSNAGGRLALRAVLIVLVIANAGLAVRAIVLGRLFPDHAMTQCCAAREQFVEAGALVEHPELIGEPSLASDMWLCDRLLAGLEEYSLDVGRTMAVIFGLHAATFAILAVVSRMGQRRVRGDVLVDGDAEEDQEQKEDGFPFARE